jgi:hypothetical protein
MENAWRAAYAADTIESYTKFKQVWPTFSSYADHQIKEIKIPPEVRKLVGGFGRGVLVAFMCDCYDSGQNWIRKRRALPRIGLGCNAMSQPENEAKEGKGMSKKPVVNIIVDAVPRGKLKDLGGGDHDQWNDRISKLVVNALPVDLKNAEAVSDAGTAAAAGMVDMKPTDPIEGVLISLSPVVLPLSEVGRCAECTAHAAVRQKASGMVITGTAAERRK